MNQPAQHISPNPALDFAQGILEETNNALELIEILNEISEGIDEEATTNDRIAANTILSDRVLGKPPKQIFPNAEPNSDPAPATDDNDVEPAPYSIRGAICESSAAVPHNEPESPRLVTQIDESLNQSLGPAPSASHDHSQSVEPAPYSIRGAGFKPAQPTSHSTEQGAPEPFDPYSIHYTIQQHILAITNNGQTLRDTLLEIARAKDDPKVKPYHRRRATILLLNRVLGTDPTALRSPVCPDCRRKWTTHSDSHDHSEPSGVVDETEKEIVPDPKWLETLAEIKRMEDEGILTPDPDAPKYDFSSYLKATDEEIAPYAAEAAAKLRADIELRYERQKQWPEIEERRRKKLAQIYPSHSDDNGEQPDT